MNEKLARVAAEKGELEHVLVQLQEENESIADYVSLYREQRSALIAKQNRREQLLHTLLHERKLLSVCSTFTLCRLLVLLSMHLICILDQYDQLSVFLILSFRIRH